MTDTEIKPCPFCGHTGITFSEGSTFLWYVASCDSCGASCGEARIQWVCRGTPQQWKAQAEIDATASWNTRNEAALPNKEPAMTAPTQAQPVIAPELDIHQRS